MGDFIENDWLLIFSLQYPPRIKFKGLENNGNDHQFRRLLIVKQILLFFMETYIPRYSNREATKG